MKTYEKDTAGLTLHSPSEPRPEPFLPLSQCCCLNAVQTISQIEQQNANINLSQNEDIRKRYSWVNVAFTFRASARAFPPSEPMLLSECGADYQSNRTTRCKHKSITK